MNPLWSHVEALQPQLWRAVCGYELNPALREELYQEVLLAIWKHLDHLRDSDRLLPFVLRIAHNLGASHVRSAVRTLRSVPLDVAQHDRPDDDRCGRQEWLFESLAALPVGLRQALMLQLEGFDYQEIGQLLGISEENVGVRLHRARAQLKALLKEDSP